MLTYEVRSYLYRVSLALQPIAVAFGFVAEDKARLIGFAVAAVLAIPTTALAVKNTPTAPKG